MPDDLDTRLKKVYVQAKSRLEQAQRERFTPIPRPVAGTKYDDEFYAALRAVQETPSKDNCAALMRAICSAAYDGCSVEHYFRAIKESVSGQKD
ncbi:hypothetical protein KY359_05090 [Candidatus Woesearchaeota archaeon]|nr:hypothetical protein [Candidatus Woesearchaeota archaeon]